MVAGAGAEIGLFKLESGEFLGTYGAGICPLVSVQFEHSGKSLLLGSNDRIAVLVALDANEFVDNSMSLVSIGPTLTGSPVDLCSSTHDRQVLVSGESDLYQMDMGGLRLILSNATDVDELVETAIQRAYRCLSEEERVEALLDLNELSWCDNPNIMND